jgi:hypothetical protein
MAINWIEGVLDNSRHSGSDLLLMLVLAESADRDSGTCWPGKATIARMMRMSERQAQRCIQNVIASGEVAVIMQGSHLGTNLYRLNPTLLKRGGQDVRGDIHDAQGESPLPPKPSVEPSKETNTRTRTKGTQIPEDWQPSPEERHYAKERGFDYREIDEMAEDFRLFYMSHRRAMPDWHLTFLRWVREEQKRRANRPAFRQSAPQARPAYRETQAY